MGKAISQLLFFHRKINVEKTSCCCIRGSQSETAPSVLPLRSVWQGHLVKYFILFAETALEHVILLSFSRTCSPISYYRPFPIPTLSAFFSYPSLSLPVSVCLHLYSLFHSSLFLGLEVFWTDLHLHPFERVGGAMPAIPGYAIQVVSVLTQAVVDPIEVGICAAVVPVST